MSEREPRQEHSHNERLARFLTVALRQKFEDLHAGKQPKTETGDYTDVTVIDAKGTKMTWAEVSHITDPQMRALMLLVEQAIATALDQREIVQYLGGTDPADGWALASYDDPDKAAWHVKPGDRQELPPAEPASNGE